MNERLEELKSNSRYHMFGDGRLLSVEDYEWLIQQAGQINNYKNFFDVASEYLGEDDFNMLIEKWNEGDSDE